MRAHTQVIKFIELKLAEALNAVEDDKLIMVLNNGQVSQNSCSAIHSSLFFLLFTAPLPHCNCAVNHGFCKTHCAFALSLSHSHTHTLSLQLYDDDDFKTDSHAALLHLTRLRMADACYSLLLTSAEEYASSLESFQVSPFYCYLFIHCVLSPTHCCSRQLRSTHPAWNHSRSVSSTLFAFHF